MIPKNKRIIDRKKRRWIKANGCLLFRPVREGCDCWGDIDPHHVIPVSLGGTDETLVPLCRAHHDEANNRERFERRHSIDLMCHAKRLDEQYKREVGVKRERPPTLKSSEQVQLEKQDKEVKRLRARLRKAENKLQQMKGYL